MAITILENQKLKHVFWFCSDKYPIMWNVHNLLWGNLIAHINLVIHVHIVLLFLLHNVWYGEDIMMEPYIFLNSILCDVVSIFLHYKMFFQTCVSSLCIQNDFYIKIGHFLGKPWYYDMWGQNVILSRIWYLDNRTLSCTIRHAY